MSRNRADADANATFLFAVHQPVRLLSWACTSIKRLTKPRHTGNPSPRPALSLRRLDLSSSSLCDSSSSLGSLRKLPIELRQQIYRYILGDDLLHLDTLTRYNDDVLHLVNLTRYDHRWKVRCYSCSYVRQPPRYTGFDASESWIRQTPYHGHYVHDSSKRPQQLTALLQTSHALYVEASEILYTTNTFAIYSIDNIFTFLAFSHSIPASRLASITSLHINLDIEQMAPIFSDRPETIRRGERSAEQWAQLWDVIGTKMAGLQDLDIFLQRGTALLMKLTGEEEWVQSMLKVKGLKRLKFQLDEEGASRRQLQPQERLPEEMDLFKAWLQVQMCAKESAMTLS
ncbi:hypothetical protein P7C71_g2884, partial [Lecanoromycetidae sp. Uapishka_2]